MGFSRHKTTGEVDTSKVYFGGRHWIGILKTFKKFPADLQTVVYKDIKIFNKEKLAVTMTCALHYKLRSHDLHYLFQTYDTTYEPVLRGAALAAIKNKAPQFTVNEYRLNRSAVARTLSEGASLELEGNCCGKDCTKETCRPGKFEHLPAHIRI